MLLARSRSIPGLGENLHRGAQRRQRQYRRIAQLPALRSRHRMKIGPHLETSRLIVAPPSGEARQVPSERVALVHETSCNTARARH